MQVLVVDDHPVIHRVMESIVLAALEGADLRSAMDLRSAVALTRELSELKLVLLDLGLPDSKGIDSLVRFRASCPGIPVVVISASEEPSCINAGMREGACGFIPKSTTPKVMICALRLVVDGGRYFPPQAFALPRREAEAKSAGARLTERETDVLRLLARGWSNREIASELRLAENTVKQHVHAVFRSLGAASRTEAVVIASRQGISL